MKKNLTLYSIVFILIATSCGNLLNVQKRHYRSGFYFHKASKGNDVGSFKGHADKDKSRNYSSRKEEVIVFAKENQKHKETTSIKPLTQKSETYKVKEVAKDIDSGTSKRYKKIATDKLSVGKKYSGQKERLPQVSNDPGYYELKAKKAKTKRRVYWILAVVLFLAIFLIPDLLAILFQLSVFFLVLSLVNNSRRKKYLKLAMSGVKYIRPGITEVYKGKAKRDKIATRIFLILTLLFLLLTLIASPAIILAIITLAFTFFFNSRRRKYEILLRAKSNPTEEEKQMDRIDEQESTIAYRKALISILSFFLALGIYVVSNYMLYVLYPLTSLLPALIFALGLALCILMFIYAYRIAKSGSEYGKRVLRRHPKEKFYKARKKASFGRVTGVLIKVLTIMASVILLLLTLTFILILPVL